MLDSYRYQLDAQDRIVLVSPEWLQFAAENDASTLTEAKVVGRFVWDFIAGEPTQQLYRALFTSLRRERKEVMIPFRCDSPTKARHMVLTLRSGPSGRLDLEGRLLRTRTREPVELFSTNSGHTPERLPVCSLCRRVRPDEEWLEVEVAIVRGRLFNTVPPPSLEEVVCDECAKVAQADGFDESR